MTTESKKEEEQELIPVGENLDEKSEEREDEDAEKEPEGKEAEKDQEGEEQEDEEEQRLGAGEEEDDEGSPEKKARRKTERKTRRERQKAARDRDAREMSFLRNRNESLERQFSELDQRVGIGEVGQVDSRITDFKSKIKLADQVISKAISGQDGDAYTEAQGIRDDLRDSLNRLEQAKVSLTRRAEIPQVDARLVDHARQWMLKHSWWDPNGGDADSRVVSRLDNELVNEDYDPTTPEYWTELTKRVAKAVSSRSGNHLDDDDELPTKKKKGKGPAFRTGGHERPLKKNEVYISPERKTAMEEAGVWEDPELRQKYLKQYAKYDAEHRT